MRLFRSLGSLFGRSRRYEDLSASISEHLAEQIDELMENGLSREEATCAARRQFGNATRIEEQSREVWQWPRIESILADVKFALRQLAKSPAFTVTAVLTLALGIGANAVTFHLLRAVVTPSLPAPRPQELQSLRFVVPGHWQEPMFSEPAYERLSRATAQTAPLAAHSWISDCSVAEGNGAGSGHASMQLVSENFFSVLGLAPAQGRFLTGADAQPQGGAWAAVLRYSYWQSRFGGDPAVVGRTLRVNGTPVIVAGVAPEHFLGVITGDAPDVWLPLEAQPFVRYFLNLDTLGYGSGINFQAPFTHQDGIFWLWLEARIPPAGRNAARAAWTSAFQGDLQRIAQFSDPGLRQAILASQFALQPTAKGESELIEKYATPMTVLMALCSLILLIACVNLASLQRTRFVARQRELAVRASLGASRSRIVQQLVIESAVLAACGGALSLAVAAVTQPPLLRWASKGPAPIPLDLRFDWPVYLFLLGVLVVGTLSFGLFPAIAATRTDLAAAMKLSGASASRGAGRHFGAWTVSLQVALSVVLLALTSMLLRTYVNLSRVNAGLDRQHVLAVHLDFHGAGYSQQRLAELYPQMVERVSALPDVRSAALEMCPIPHCGWHIQLHAAGHPALSAAARQGQQDVVGSGYFRTLGIPLLLGRDFTAEDRAATEKVAILNASYAKQLFGNENPIGQRVGFGPAPNDAAFRVVGVVADARLNDLDAPPPPLFYVPLTQALGPIAGFEVRAAGDPRQVTGEVRSALLGLDPKMPLEEIVPLEVLYERTITTQHLLARLTTAFGTLALALAAIGIYGVLSFRVAAAASEIGVRMALGAQRATIVRFVLTQGARMLLAGAVPGCVLALLLGRAIHQLLYGMSGTDWLSLCGAAVMLAMVALPAAWLPARRAASVDPMQALRSE
ncbi:MAG TPA: ABC transporter permease [Acidobacteriaceae bacterium]|nr:ABC transporter permease [Acidobacteriaceae bacterium]